MNLYFWYVSIVNVLKWFFVYLFVLLKSWNISVWVLGFVLFQLLRFCSAWSRNVSRRAPRPCCESSTSNSSRGSASPFSSRGWPHGGQRRLFSWPKWPENSFVLNLEWSLLSAEIPPCSDTRGDGSGAALKWICVFSGTKEAAAPS